MKTISKTSNRIAANDFASMSTDKLKMAIDTEIAKAKKIAEYRQPVSYLAVIHKSKEDCNDHQTQPTAAPEKALVARLNTESRP